MVWVQATFPRKLIDWVSQNHPNFFLGCVCDKYLEYLRWEQIFLHNVLSLF